MVSPSNTRNGVAVVKVIVKLAFLAPAPNALGTADVNATSPALVDTSVDTNIKARNIILISKL